MAGNLDSSADQSLMRIADQLAMIDKAIEVQTSCCGSWSNEPAQASNAPVSQAGGG
jgi:hypothetical protein